MIFWYKISHYMQEYQMKLATGPYNNIALRKKVIESRLFDEKRQQIALGDQIVFSENDKPENSVTTVSEGAVALPNLQRTFCRPRSISIW